MSPSFINDLIELKVPVEVLGSLTWQFLRVALLNSIISFPGSGKCRAEEGFDGQTLREECPGHTGRW